MSTFELYKNMPQEKGKEMLIWQYETQIAQAEEEIERLKKELIGYIESNQFENTGYYNLHLNRLKTIIKESSKALSLIKCNLED